MTNNIWIGWEFSSMNRSQNANIKWSQKLYESAFSSFFFHSHRSHIVLFIVSVHGLISKQNKSSLCLCNIFVIVDKLSRWCYFDEVKLWERANADLVYTVLIDWIEVLFDIKYHFTLKIIHLSCYARLSVIINLLCYMLVYEQVK